MVLEEGGREGERDVGREGGRERARGGIVCKVIFFSFLFFWRGRGQRLKTLAAFSLVLFAEGKLVVALRSGLALSHTHTHTRLTLTSCSWPVRRCSRPSSDVGGGLRPGGRSKRRGSKNDELRRCRRSSVAAIDVFGADKSDAAARFFSAARRHDSQRGVIPRASQSTGMDDNKEKSERERARERERHKFSQKALTKHSFFFCQRGAPTSSSSPLSLLFTLPPRSFHTATPPTGPGLPCREQARVPERERPGRSRDRRGVPEGASAGLERWRRRRRCFFSSCSRCSPAAAASASPSSAASERTPSLDTGRPAPRGCSRGHSRGRPRRCAPLQGLG